jgi:hypothetical protein
MPAAKPMWHARLARGWFALGALMAFWAHATTAIGVLSTMGALDFDDPLRLVEVIYAAKGLTPYADFGFVYPPGQVWFYGKLLGLQNPATIVAAIIFSNLLLWSICAWQMMRLTPGRRLWFGGAVLLLLGGTIPLVSESLGSALSQPLPLLLIAVLLVVEVMERGTSPARLATLVCVTVVGTLFRWDWILFVVVLEAGWAAAIWLVVRTLKPDQSIVVKPIVVHLWQAVLAALAGEVLALAMIVGHALATGTWTDTRLFIFYVPLHILPFRRLPLPMGIHASRQWLEAIIGMTLIALAASLEYVKTRAWPGFVYLLKGGALLAPCIALLPFAFGRADDVHFLPLTALVMVTSMAALTLWSHRTARLLLLMALTLNAWPRLHTAVLMMSIRSMPKADIHLERVHKLTAGCTDIFPRDARSLFVGQASYDRFIMNSPVFYLMRADLRPATPFISDEPGVQNSCTLGSRIAADLIRAPRPLVLVLDTKPYDPEPNLTRAMTSCGRIEAATAAMRAAVIGTCQVTDDYYPDQSRTFQVMVVR